MPSLVVAVATTEPPSFAVTGMENVAAPAPSVVTVASPRSAYVSRPSAEAEKTWMRVAVEGFVAIVPVTAVRRALVTTGVFCRPLGPVSASPGSLAVNASGTRSIPRL